MKRQGLRWLAGAALALLLVGGLARLFQLRFQAGDVFPAYSSLRADPLGTRVFYESLAACGVSVERNFRPLGEQRLPAESVLLLLGAELDYLPNSDLIPVRYARELNEFMRRGGRVVLTLLPRSVADGKSVSDWLDEPAETNAPAKTNAPAAVTNAPSGRPAGGEGAGKFMGTTNWLGASFALVAGGQTSAAARSVSAAVPEDLPRAWICHTDLCFSNAGAGWSVLYQRAGCPVLMEKKIGNGSLVVSTPSFFLSNEALRNERQPGLLLWLLGGKKRVIFDETHLGLTQGRDLFSLIHQYRLGGALLCLLLCAVLFIWRSSVSLVPPEHRGGGAGGEPAFGKDSMAGLVNLLRRNVPPRELLPACFTAWHKTVERAGGPRPACLRNIAAIVETAAGDRAAAGQVYNQIVSLLKAEKKR